MVDKPPTPRLARRSFPQWPITPPGSPGDGSRQASTSWLSTTMRASSGHGDLSELWRSFIKPPWQTLLDSVRRSYPDCDFFLHSCGNITEIVPDIVDLGFHILHPIQPGEVIDFEKLRGQYGRHLTLSAPALAPNILFPFSVRQRRCGNGCFGQRIYTHQTAAAFCPSNRVQPETPWENIVAFVEAARATHTNKQHPGREIIFRASNGLMGRTSCLRPASGELSRSNNSNAFEEYQSHETESNRLVCSQTSHTSM